MPQSSTSRSDHRLEVACLARDEDLRHGQGAGWAACSGQARLRGDRTVSQRPVLQESTGDRQSTFERLDAKASELREVLGELSVRLLEHTQAPITPYKGFVRFEIDTFVLDNSNTQKEHDG